MKGQREGSEKHKSSKEIVDEHSAKRGKAKAGTGKMLISIRVLQLS